MEVGVVTPDFRKYTECTLLSTGARVWHPPGRAGAYTRGTTHPTHPWTSQPLPLTGDWYEVETRHWAIGDVVPDVGVVTDLTDPDWLERWTGFKPFPASRLMWKWDF